MAGDAHEGSVVVRWLASLMLVQALSRGVHFVLNFLVIRMMAPEAYGVAALQLPLVSMAATRVLKEALHRLCVRQDTPSGESESNDTKGNPGSAEKGAEISPEESRALLWWGIVLGGLVSSALAGAFLGLRAPAGDGSEEWVSVALLCWLGAAWGELLSEPVIVELERRAIVGPTVAVEVLALFAESGLTVVGFVFPDAFPAALSHNVAVVTAVAHLGYGFVLCLGYWLAAWRHGWIRTLLPLSSSSWRIRMTTASASVGFILQSLGKFVTAEGEAMILFALGTPAQQGVFQFVANLGSIVARVFFLSIERTAYIMFTGASRSNSNRAKADEDRRVVWNVLMRVSITIALLYLTTCPPFIKDLVLIVYGPKWADTDAPLLLSVYGFYLLLLAVNGMTEAYRDAVVPYDRLRQQSWFTIGFMLAYFGVGILAVSRFGAFGLILASCANTGARWLFCMWYFRSWLPSIRPAIPGGSTWGVCLVASALGFFSRPWVMEVAPLGRFSHLLISGGGIGAALLIWLATAQLSELRGAWRMMKSKKME
jgi:oligosaccharide translocation protein RFT1